MVKPLAADSEQALVDRCRRGDEAAWAQLYREHGPSVRVYVSHALGPGAAVDDVVQRVFLEALRALGRFRGEASLRTWLHRIASSELRKQRRSWWRWRRKEEAFGACAPCEAPDLHQATEARAQLKLVAEALADLNVEFRMAWLLIEVEGLSAEEAAQALDVRPATLRTRHFRAKQKIMDFLQAQEAVPNHQGVAGRQSPLTSRAEVHG